MTQSPPRTVSVPAHQLQAFEPAGLGVHEAGARALFGRLSGKPQSAIVAELQREHVRLPDPCTQRDDAAYETMLLVLRDYIGAGYYPVIAEGRCFLAPIWESKSLDPARKRRTLQRLYEGMRERDLEVGQHAARLEESATGLDVEGGYDPSAVLRLLAADALEPCLTVVTTASQRRLWKAVRSTWSMMPDRSAPGREVSFLFADKRYPGTPLGIFQFRNVVPEIKSRDLWLGTSVAGVGDGLPPTGYVAAAARSGDPSAAMSATRDILTRLLESVNPQGLSATLKDRDIVGLSQLAASHRVAFNQAKKDNDPSPNLHLAISKRAQTAAELCRGILGLDQALTYTDPLQAFADPEIVSACDSGIRKIWHYHMGFVAIEMSICGAAPPFGPMRFGKLMAALAGSRTALEAWGYDRPLGDIARQVYLPEVRERVPNPGPLVLLTSGLYPGHSAQYTRVKAGERSWVKYGETSGYGSFHVSNATTAAMGRFNVAADGYRHITRAFGEGSGAKFREVGRALDRLKLPDLRKHNTQRPLYALPLVDDVAGILLGWAEHPSGPAPSVADVAAQWETRWVAPRLDELLDRSGESPDLLQSLAVMVDRAKRQTSQ